MVDALTGLWNRYYFDLQLAPHLSMSKRSGRPLACIVADVDHLKAINIKHGEGIGSEVLRSVGRILLSHCRAEDLVCRFDSGKFAILMGGADRTTAARLADRLRSEIERQLKTRGGVDLNVTCSFGVADTQGAVDETLIARADTATFRAKQIGRNCVSAARRAGAETATAA
jgi:diguanylate cyclase (GGDEF)-like protein